MSDSKAKVDYVRIAFVREVTQSDAHNNNVMKEVINALLPSLEQEEIDLDTLDLWDLRIDKSVWKTHADHGGVNPKCFLCALKDYLRKVTMVRVFRVTLSALVPEQKSTSDLYDVLQKEAKFLKKLDELHIDIGRPDREDFQLPKFGANVMYFSASKLKWDTFKQACEMTVKSIILVNTAPPGSGDDGENESRTHLQGQEQLPSVWAERGQRSLNWEKFLGGTKGQYWEEDTKGQESSSEATDNTNAKVSCGNLSCSRNIFNVVQSREDGVFRDGQRRLRDDHNGKNRVIKSLKDPYKDCVNFFRPSQFETVGDCKSRVRIAVLDTAVDAFHPDLSACIDWRGSRSFVQDETWFAPLPDEDHGTHVAGIVGGSEFGFARRFVELVVVKVLRSDRMGSFESIIKGLKHAVEEKVDIVNLSLGGKGFHPELYREMQEIAGKPPVIVCACGNSGTLRADELEFPANISSVIRVGAVDMCGQPSGFSSVGSMETDTVGLGADVLSTVPTLSQVPLYAVMNGTSMAAPCISATIALCLVKCNDNPKFCKFNIHEHFIRAMLREISSNTTGLVSKGRGAPDLQLFLDNGGPERLKGLIQKFLLGEADA